jgi:Cytochrome P460
MPIKNLKAGRLILLLSESRRHFAGLPGRMTVSAIILVCVLGLAVLLWQGQPHAQQPSKPQYDSGGQLLLPQGFETWIFAGSNLGLGYAKGVTAVTQGESRRPAEQNYHNVYINPIGYSQYLATGTFPEGTMLVMDVYEAAQTEISSTARPSVLNAGTFNGKRRRIEVAVKDANRPNRRDDPQHLSVQAWAYYAFDFVAPGHLQPGAGRFDDSACYACHVDHAGDENVWVQFYPTLRRVKQPE